jgi:hypothetical protein
MLAQEAEMYSTTVDTTVVVAGAVAPAPDFAGARRNR